jgi:DNA-binding CsgD family transcriptional regulator
MAYRAQATLRLANRDHAEALYWGEKAIALAEGFDDMFVLAMAHIAVGSAWLFLDYERGHSYLERRLKLEYENGSAIQIANLYAYLGASSVELYRFNQAERYLSEGIDFVADQGLDIFVRFMRAWLALSYIYLGRWNEADELINRLLQSQPGAAIRRIPTLVALGRLRARQGDPGAQVALEAALQLAIETGTLQHLGLVYAARAEAAWLVGDRQRTLEEARAVYDLAVSKRHPWFTAELAFWRWQAGDEVSPPDWAAKPFVLQMAGEWHAAADEWERLGCPFEQARALAAGDSHAQIAALQIYEQLGAQTAAEGLRRSLQGIGGLRLPRKPRASTRQNPFGLTHRQVEILALLIEGLSNADIAARLHISPKTTDHHVSAILTRMDVRTRQAAAALAKEHPSFNK